MAMDAEPPPRDDHNGRDTRRARRALWLAGVGVVAALVTVVTGAIGDITLKQAIIFGLPAAVLTFGGLLVALASSPETAERQGFQAGLIAGSLRARWRLFFGRHAKRRP
jgi:hypothetical protein